MANIIKFGGVGSKFKEIAFGNYHWNGSYGNMSSAVIVKKDMTVLTGATIEGDFLKLQTYADSGTKQVSFIANADGKFYYKSVNGSSVTEDIVTVTKGTLITRANGWTTNNIYCCVVAL